MIYRYVRSTWLKLIAMDVNEIPKTAIWPKELRKRKLLANTIRCKV